MWENRRVSFFVRSYCITGLSRDNRKIFSWLKLIFGCFTHNGLPTKSPSPRLSPNPPPNNDCFAHIFWHFFRFAFEKEDQKCFCLNFEDSRAAAALRPRFSPCSCTNSAFFASLYNFLNQTIFLLRFSFAESYLRIFGSQWNFLVLFAVRISTGSYGVSVLSLIGLL